MSARIHLVYSAGGFRKPTSAGSPVLARAFVEKWLGRDYLVGETCAVSMDGKASVHVVSGATLSELFPRKDAP